MFFMPFVVMDSDVVIVKVNQGSFFIGSEEVVLTIIVNSFEGLH